MKEDRGQKSGVREQRFFEFGSRTRRRPIGRDYAAAKDAEWGIMISGILGEVG